MLQSQRAAAAKALLRAMLLRTSLLRGKLLVPHLRNLGPSDPQLRCSSLSQSCSRLDGWERRFPAWVPRSLREQEEEGAGRTGEAGPGGGPAGVSRARRWGAGGSGGGRDVRLAKLARPAVSGANRARTEEREGLAQARCERMVPARPGRPPLGGAVGSPGGGAARDPRVSVHSVVSPVERTRSGRVGLANPEKGTQRPLGRHSPRAKGGFGGGKWGEQTMLGLTER